jgi:hypothetical protein
MTDLSNAIKEAEARAAKVPASDEDTEMWHRLSDELWLFVLEYVAANSSDPGAVTLAKIALKPRSNTDGWYA